MTVDVREGAEVTGAEDGGWEYNGQLIKYPIKFI
jgi:hypothetical protein